MLYVLALGHSTKHWGCSINHILNAITILAGNDYNKIDIKRLFCPAHVSTFKTLQSLLTKGFKVQSSPSAGPAAVVDLGSDIPVVVVIAGQDVPGDVQRLGCEHRLKRVLG